MREIPSNLVSESVAKLFIEANYQLGDDVLGAIKKAACNEESEVGRDILQNLVENARIAARGAVPLCQDCGTAVVFLEIGQDVHITGGDLYGAVNAGVKQAYEQGYLRKSMVKQPFSERTNTGDNTPAIIYTDIVQGDRIKIIAAPKGGGAENMSRLCMLTPADGRTGIVNFVVKVVEEAGSNPWNCRPSDAGCQKSLAEKDWGA
jgi:fumarate hydratase subunit alpha